MAAARLAYLDDARALGIALVVFGHAFGSIEHGGGGPSGTSIDTTLSAIYTFHIPLFFFLAGMSQRLSSAHAPQAMTRSLIRTVLYPYVVWTLIIVGLKSLFSGVANHVPHLGDIAAILLFNPVDHLWFLHVLLVIRLIWLLVELANRPFVRPLIVVVPLVVIVVQSFAGLTNFLVWTCFWGSFYGLGTCLAADRLPAMGKAPRLGLAALGAVVWVTILYRVPTVNEQAPNLLRFLVALAPIVTVMTLTSFAPPARSLPQRLIAFLGEASLAIYLAHTVVGTIVRLALAAAGSTSMTAMVMAYTLCGLALPALAYALLVTLGRRHNLPLAALAGFGSARRLVYFP